MDTKPTVSRVRSTNDINFEASAMFKICNIRWYFERDLANTDAQLLEDYSFWTTAFGPGLSLYISPSKEMKAMDIALNLRKSKYLPWPVTVAYKFYFFPLSRCISQDTEHHYYIEDTDTWLDGDDEGKRWRRAMEVEEWQKYDILRADDGFCLVVEVKSLPIHPTPTSSAALDVLHDTILTPASPSTVRFTVFNRRAPSGKLTDRRVLTVDYGILDENCSFLARVISRKALWDDFLVEYPLHGDPRACNDTSNDSDFEDIVAEPDDHSGTSESTIPTTQSVAENDETKPIVASNGDNNTDVTLVCSSDHDAQMEIDDDPKDNNSHDPPQNTIRDVVVVGAASVTWEAVMFYLYTGVIDFAPLSSSGIENRVKYIEDHTKVNRPKPCSSKSVYVLARKMGLKPLMKLALKTITEQLTLDNILLELFSAFTSRFEQVKKAEVEFLVEHWDQVTCSDRFKETMSKVALGTYPHAGEILSEVFMKMKPKSSAQ